MADNFKTSYSKFGFYSHNVIEIEYYSYLQNNVLNHSFTNGKHFINHFHQLRCNVFDFMIFTACALDA